MTSLLLGLGIKKEDRIHYSISKTFILYLQLLSLSKTIAQYYRHKITMKKATKHLLSLPPNLATNFHTITQHNTTDFYCTSDPIENRVGSGGGTSWLLSQCWKNQDEDQPFEEWLSSEKRILIHAGGQSRRLPSYAPSGKLLAPIPVFRWSRGQKLNQTLLDLQSPLYEKIIQSAPAKVNTLIASGDVLILNNQPLAPLPEADVICYGLWSRPELASRHGVFVCKKNNPERLSSMLQKPSVRELQELGQSHLCLMDIGIWLLSDRAVELLMKKSGYKNGQSPNTPPFYDLYSEFGLAMGETPTLEDNEISKLSVAVIPLEGGEFYHYGTSKELISSTLAIQNRVIDPRSILHKDRKPHPSMFIQNAHSEIHLSGQMENLWIENSHISQGWKLSSNHIVTGIPENDWSLNLSSGVCLDIVPIGKTEYCVRPYHINDQFKGALGDDSTNWLEKPFKHWLQERGLSFESAKLDPDNDIQDSPIFPICTKEELNSSWINWLLDSTTNETFTTLWANKKRLSANQLSEKANLSRLFEQRKSFRLKNWPAIRNNFKHSIFFQLNLDQAAKEFAEQELPVQPLDNQLVDPQVRLAEKMFQARVLQYQGQDFSHTEEEAFSILRETILKAVSRQTTIPQLNIHQDQIVWGRSPARIDLAGGWTDTPPYCLFQGGKVVNMAINLNGQPPLQCYIRPTDEYQIVIRSIDLGKRESITNYNELANYNQIGSAFSIPKAALCLAGFHPDFTPQHFKSLKEQLKAFGSGIEITMLAAIPKGSGLGTSSALAATVLGTLSDFCGLNWSHTQISMNTLILEQLLTTGGGWQDQFGAILPGVKLLETNAGFNQEPAVRWAPDYLFTKPEFHSCMLLYYTGITRTAKNILAEIVRGMFLNGTQHLDILEDMKQHAVHTFNTLQKNDYNELAACIAKTWQQKQRIDHGTNPPAIQQLIHLIEDLTAAYKLPGAGGGGYLFILAKDPQAALKIKKRLSENPPNLNARFVDLELSTTGFQLTRS